MCVVSNIMERVISKRILEHLSTNQLLSSAQHGFVSKRSTCTNLLESLNDWSLTIQDGHSVTVAYIYTSIRHSIQYRTTSCFTAYIFTVSVVIYCCC